MDDAEFKLFVTNELRSISQELRGFNGTPGLCKRVSTVEKTVRNIIYGLCITGGLGGTWAGVDKLLGG